MNDWRKPCEHGEYEYHVAKWCKHGQTHMHTSSEWACAGPDHCPGGSLVTAADLEELGHRRWFCVEHDASQPANDGPEDFHRCYEWWMGEIDPETPLLGECQMVERLLIPLGDLATA